MMMKEVILDYENFILHESKVAPLILRPSGLYDERSHWMRNHVNAFDGKNILSGLLKAICLAGTISHWL